MTSKTFRTWVPVAYVTSVSVRFRSKERGTRVKDCAKNGASNGSRFISRVVKTGLSLLRNQKEMLAMKARVPVNISQDLWARSRKLFLMGFEMLAI